MAPRNFTKGCKGRTLSRSGIQRIMDASAYAFGAQEQINRIAAALAFYRSAQKKGHL